MSATLIDIAGEKHVLTVLNDITERRTIEMRSGKARKSIAFFSLQFPTRS
jgi:phage protein U